MSRRGDFWGEALPGDPLAVLSSRERLHYFSELYRRIGREDSGRFETALEKIEEGCRKYDLRFNEDEKAIFAALDTPIRVQRFLNTQILYNNDHKMVGQEQTAMSPLMVLSEGRAHCFEAALLAYAINFLHGYSPRLVLLEATRDVDHNLVVYQAPGSRLWGANAHSRYFRLDGRDPIYPTLSTLVDSYWQYYYDEETHDFNDKTLVGYSEPVDLVHKFGTDWIGKRRELWEIYFQYIDQGVKFFPIGEEKEQWHMYPMFYALEMGWIKTEADYAFVDTDSLPIAQKEIYLAYKNAERLGDKKLIRSLNQNFFELTGERIDASDIDGYVEEVGDMLAHGYPPKFGAWSGD